MTWIRTVPYPEATGRLKTLYDRGKGPGDNVDNIMMAHSLRPNSMEGHMTLYKYVLHHSAIRAAFEAGTAAEAFDAKDLSAVRYAERLTREPAGMTVDAVAAMRAAGWDDGEILEINQVVAYFAYANRTVLGLGVDTDGDILGLSPGENDDPENWSHA